MVEHSVKFTESLVGCQIAALKTLEAAETTSALVLQCQKTLNGISAWHTVLLYWVLGHAWVQGNEITDKLARGGSIQDRGCPRGGLGRLSKVR